MPSVAIYRCTETVHVAVGGSDYKKNHEQYKAKINHYLLSIIKDRKLQEVRDAVVEEINNKHLKAHPKWPSVGTPQNSYIEIDSKGSYTYVHLKIFWSVWGSMHIKVGVWESKSGVFEWYRKVKLEFASINSISPDLWATINTGTLLFSHQREIRLL